MPDLCAELIAEARRKHGTILPCASKRTLEECFTVLPDGGLVLWFNTPDGNTHIERELKEEVYEATSTREVLSRS